MNTLAYLLLHTATNKVAERRNIFSMDPNLATQNFKNFPASKLHMTWPAIGYLGILVRRGGTSSVVLKEICLMVWIGC